MGNLNLRDENSWERYGELLRNNSGGWEKEWGEVKQMSVNSTKLRIFIAAYTTLETIELSLSKFDLEAFL